MKHSRFNNLLPLGNTNSTTSINDQYRIPDGAEPAAQGLLGGVGVRLASRAHGGPSNA